MRLPSINVFNLLECHGEQTVSLLYLLCFALSIQNYLELLTVCCVVRWLYHCYEHNMDMNIVAPVMNIT